MFRPFRYGYRVFSAVSEFGRVPAAGAPSNERALK